MSSGLTGLAVSSTGFTACPCELCPFGKVPSPSPLCSSEKRGPFLLFGTAVRVIDSVREGTSSRWYTPSLEVFLTGEWGWGSNHLKLMTRSGRVPGMLAGCGRGQEEADPCWSLMPVGPVHRLAQLTFPRTPWGKPCSPLTQRGAGTSLSPSQPLSCSDWLH